MDPRAKPRLRERDTYFFSASIYATPGRRGVNIQGCQRTIAYSLGLMIVPSAQDQFGSTVYKLISTMIHR